MQDNQFEDLESLEGMKQRLIKEIEHDGVIPSLAETILTLLNNESFSQNLNILLTTLIDILIEDKILDSSKFQTQVQKNFTELSSEIENKVQEYEKEKNNNFTSK